jgi:hypothetical protein
VRLLDVDFRAVDFRALAAFFALDFLVAADFLAAVDRLADLAFLVAAAFLADFLVVAISLLLHREESLSPVCCSDRSQTRRIHSMRQQLSYHRWDVPGKSGWPERAPS